MKFKFNPIFKEISLILVTQVIVLVSFFFIYQLIGENIGPKGVGEYSLIKRLIGVLQPILLLGLATGIPRYIGMTNEKIHSSTYLKAGGLVSIGFTSIFLIFINLFRDYSAKIFFGSINYNNLVLPFSFFLAGLIFHALIYSYFRGRLLVKTFNLLHIINLAILPVIILIFFRNITLEKLVTLIGIITSIIAFIFCLCFIKDIFIGFEKRRLKNSLKKLLRYSLPRIPSDLILASFFSFGPIFAVHFASIEEVGYLSISQSMIHMAGIAFYPLYIILLPKVSSLIAQQREESIKENLNFLIGIIFQCSIFVSVQLMIFTDAIIKYWLGPKFLNAIPIMRIVFISMTFYAFYIAMRSILDAYKVKPINTINLLISLGIFLLIIIILLFIFNFFSSIISLSIAFSSAIMCLGILTYFSVRKIYPERFKKDLNYFCVAIIIALALGIMAILAKPLIISKLHYLIIFEVFLGVIYLLILWQLNTDWLRIIPKKIMN